MNIINAIKMAEEKKLQRGYDYLYWCIDLHGVILTPTYKINNDGATYYPLALETLKILSNIKTNQLILWTSSHKESILDMLAKFRELDIHFNYINNNPHYTITPICDFTNKFYFDILLDDKAGFEGELDWKVIYDYLTKKESL